MKEDISLEDPLRRLLPLDDHDLQKMLAIDFFGRSYIEYCECKNVCSCGENSAGLNLESFIKGV